MKAQKNRRIKGRNVLDRTLAKSTTGRTNKISNALNIANTPPNLESIDRKIAQKGNRYHSGTILAGVDIGLAIM